MKSSKNLSIYLILGMLLLIDSACSNIKGKETKDIILTDNKKKPIHNKLEAQFLIDLAEIKINQINLGQLAQHKSATPLIIQLGKKVEDESFNSLCELKEIAQALEIVLPVSLSENGKEAYQRLSNKSAKYFDNSYTNIVVDDYKEEIALIDMAANNSQQPKIVAWATSATSSSRTVLLHSQVCKEKYD